MQYITAQQASEKWGITVRRVQDLCRSHAIDGALGFVAMLILRKKEEYAN